MSEYIDEYQYTIEHSLLTALVNGDASGISDDEDEALEKFIDDLNERTVRNHGSSAFAAIVKPDDETEFTRCDVTGYRGLCYDVTALVYQTH